MAAATLCLGCFHAAHPNGACARTFDGGPGRSTSCGCRANVLGSQRDEDMAVLRRNLPEQEWTRLTRLAEPLPAPERPEEQAVVDAAREVAAIADEELLSYGAIRDLCAAVAALARSTPANEEGR